MTEMRLPEGFDPIERGDRAERFFNEGYNCCQSVVLAFSDILHDSCGLSESMLTTISSGFGGGFGRLREVCGAVSGMTLMAGFMRPSTDPSIKEERAANYALVQEFASAFKAESGSIVCRELLGLAGHPKETPVPSDRTPEYYKKRPCGQQVRTAAIIVAEKLLAGSGHSPRKPVFFMKA